MMETDDKLIRDFFNENRQEVPDRGFSRRVMRKLPQRRNLVFKICGIVIALFAFALFIAYGGLLGIIYLFRDMFISLAQNSNLFTDPKSIIIAVIVLAILGFNKIWSMD